MRAEVYRAWINEGRDAARHGARRSPYPPGSLADLYWREGHAEVERELSGADQFRATPEGRYRYA